MASFNIGDLITFSYPAVHLQGTKAHDRYPQVLVLHNGWNRHPPNNPPGNFLLHGLNFNYLTADEINMVRMILDPSFEMKHKEALQKKNPNLILTFDSIMSRAQNADIASPLDFYTRVIKPFISPKQWDPYRLYNLKKITNVRILQRKQYLEGQPESVFAKFAKKAKALVSTHPGLAPRPPTRLPSRLPTFGGPHRPGALPGTEER